MTIRLIKVEISEKICKLKSTSNPLEEAIQKEIKRQSKKIKKLNVQKNRKLK